jgi:hypothetical protein
MSKEPSGFPNRTDSAVTFDNGTRTLSVAPVSDSFEYYVQGVKYKHLSAATSQITDTEGLWHFYFDGYTLQNTQAFTQAIITDHAYVALIYWDAANNQAIYFGEERHGMAMDGATHIYLHNTNGAVYINGLGLGDFSIDGSGGISADGYFSVANGIIYDEDIIHTITDGSPQDLAPISRLPVFFREGTAGDWRRKPIDPFPVVYPGSVSGYDLSNTLLAYNNFNGTTWSLQEVANNNYVLVHVLATNDKVHPVIAILGTNEYNNSNAARTGATTELATLSGLPFAELVPVGTVIFQTSSGYTNAIKGRIVSTDTGEDYVDFRNVAALPIGQINDHGNLSGLSDADHPATAIYTNTALFNGNLSSADNTVQAALDTLDNISIVSGSGTATQLAYFTGAAALGSETAVGSDALTWDAANNRLGIRTSVPSTALDVSGADAKINGLAIGRGNAGAAATSTALGVSALAVATGASNTAVGASAADAVTTGASNTAVGSSALGAAATASDNTALGAAALLVNTASELTAVGSGALDANTTGTGHVAVGYNALGTVTTGTDCAAVGHSALAANTGSQNTSVGSSSSAANTSGQFNTAVGYQSLFANSVGSYVTAIGWGAVAAVLTAAADGVTAIGAGALAGNTSGSGNTAIGYFAGNLNSTASQSTYVGYQSGWKANGGSNTGLGYRALGVNSSVTGSANVAVGRQAGEAVTTGSQNAFVGASAGQLVSSGSVNVAVGDSALGASTSGTRNVAVGQAALLADTQGTDSVAVGYRALDVQNPTTATAMNNVAVGSGAGGTVTLGTGNTLIGTSAGSRITTGDNNVIIGNGADVPVGFGNSDNTIVIGQGASSPSVLTNSITLGNSTNDYLRLGTTSTTTPNPGIDFSESGGFGVGATPVFRIGHSSATTGSNFVVFYGGGGTRGLIGGNGAGGVNFTSISDYRVKSEVEGIADPLTRLLSLRPCSFRMTGIATDAPRVEGFIAHEVQAVVPEAVSGVKDAADAEGNPVYQGLDQGRLVPLVVAACQELAAKATAAEARADAAEARIAALEAAILRLSSQ